MPKIAQHALSASEISNLQDQKNELEATVRELEKGTGKGTAAEGIDVGALKHNIKHLNKAIYDGVPKVATRQKNTMYSRAKELASQIKEGMPTWQQMHHPTKFPGIVRKNVEWTKANSGRIAEWKQLQRKIDPENPQHASVETLRRMK